MQLPEALHVFISPVNGKFGYVDRSGKVVIAPRFDQAEAFTEGLAAVLMNEMNVRGTLIVLEVFRLSLDSGASDSFMMVWLPAVLSESAVLLTRQANW